MMRDASRRVVAPRGIDVPARLPGGVWGGQPFVCGIKFTGAGIPFLSFADDPGKPATTETPVPKHLAQAAEIRAEQPWPQVWAARCGIVAMKEAPVGINPPITLEFEVEMAVESARFSWLFNVGWFGGISQMVPPQLTPIELVGQVIRIWPRRALPINTNTQLANFETILTFTWLLGLVAPPQRVTP